MAKIDCEVHGSSDPAFVCQYIAQGLFERTRVGFCWTQEEPDNPHPDAWCSACEMRRRKVGGGWIGEAAENLQARILCSHCYQVAKQFHLGGNPWS